LPEDALWDKYRKRLQFIGKESKINKITDKRKYAMKKPRFFLAEIFLVLFCGLALVSGMLPAGQPTYRLTYFGTFDGGLDPMTNGTQVTQEMTIPKPFSRLYIGLTKADQEMPSGTVGVVLTREPEGTEVYRGEFPATPDAADQDLCVPVNLDPGEYRLTLTFAGFTEGKYMTCYADAESDVMGKLVVNGVPTERCLHITAAEESTVYPVPWLAAAVLLVFLGYLLFRKEFGRFRFWGAVILSAGAVALLAVFIPVDKKILRPMVLCGETVLVVVSALRFGKKEGYLPEKIMDAVLNFLRERKPVWLRGGIVLAAAVLIGGGIEGCAAFLCRRPFLFPRWAFWAAVAFAVGFHAVFRKAVQKDLWKSFFVAALLAGLMLCFLAPATTLVSWDDEVHYERVLRLSEGPIAYFSRADSAMTHRTVSKTFSLAQIRENEEFLESNRDIYSFKPSRTAWTVDRVGYLPYVPGLWLGRILGLSFQTTFLLGRASNLLFYVLILCLAMKRLKSGQLLVYVLGMLPTGLFLASSYSYDGWVNCLTILGFACFIGAMQRKDEPLTDREKWIMLSALVIGCIPKAVYTLMIPLLLLMPKEKFSAKEEHRRYIRSVLIATAVGIGIYLVPFLLGGAFSASTDSRGGSDVNAVEQVKFVLTHPIQYAGILLNFLKSYLSPEQSYGYTSFLAFLNGRDLHTVIFTVMVAAALTDRGPGDLTYRKGGVMLGSAVWMFIVMCAVASAMYVTYTPVGYGTVNGCQPRYLIPMLFPLLMVAGNIHIISGTGQKLTKYLLSAVSAYTAFAVIWDAIIRQYTL